MNLRTSVSMSLALACLASAAPVTGQPARAAPAEEPPTPAPPVVQAAPPPPEMERLDFLVGTWANTAVFYDAEGNELGRFDALEQLPDGASGSTITPALGGWILESSAGTQYGRGWFRYEPGRGEYMLAAVDFQGNFDVLAGGFEGDELVLTEVAPKPARGGGTIMWRWTYYDIVADSLRLKQEFSRDEGATWTLANRQLYRRME